MLTTLNLHNEASVHNREGHPGGYLGLYKTGHLQFSQFPATPSKIEDATESTCHVSSYQLYVLTDTGDGNQESVLPQKHC